MTSFARKEDTRLAPCVAAPFPKHKKVVDLVVASAHLPFEEDEEVVEAIIAAITPFYSLESKLGDYYRADAIRTEAFQRITGKSLDGLLWLGFNYNSIWGSAGMLVASSILKFRGIAVPQINHIKETKLKHTQADQLVKRLCMETVNLEYLKASSLFVSPLETATFVGTREVVEEILESFPSAVYFQNAMQQTLMRSAILNRRENVYNLIYQFHCGDLFISTADARRNNGLHLAGKLGPPQKLNLRASAAEMPFIRFAQLTANQAILEAVQNQQAIHILDFNILHDVQWPPLMQAIAERGFPLPSLRITGTGSDLDILRRTGDRLAKFAHSLGLKFQFRPLLLINTDDYDPTSTVLLLPGETLAVNCVL
ncbi:hypothetical protein RJ640_016844 [Escallonia rubra]|uniref:Uncharacterized protein n=1 Tax=Escallonia rubra TaxID=112253 RepID=A0AA88U5E6_9ASTE|nr:hypothetical protein RJ640_016844 [Escallonia rubra]